MARLLVLGGNEAEAEVLFDELVVDANICEHETLPWAVFQVAEEYYNKGFALRDSGDVEGWRAYLGEARGMWERLGERFPERYSKWNLVADLRYFTGVCCRITGDYAAALGYYESILTEYPDYQYAWSAEYLRAGCIEGLMREGAVPALEAFGEIEKCYKRVVNEYTGCGSYRDALRNLGLLNFRRKDWADAANYMERYLYEYGGEEPPRALLFKLGQVYDNLKEPALAVYYYQRYLAHPLAEAASIQRITDRLGELEGGGL